jgi:hypothetical protein
MDISTEDLPNAKLVRLKNGDDIIAEVVEMGEGKKITSLILINPLKAVYAPSTTTGYIQIAFMPWVYPRICSEQTFTIDIDEVLICCDVSKTMNEYYWDSIDTYINEQKNSDKSFNETEKENHDSDMEETIKDILEQLEMGNKKVFH